MLVTGMVVMYETKAFWGLEENTNAATINNTFNSFTNLSGLLVVVVMVIAVVLAMCTRRAF